MAVEFTIGVAIVLQIIGIVLLVVLLRRQTSSDTNHLASTFKTIETSQARLETIVREEMVNNRREITEQSRIAREEANAALIKLSEQFAGLIQSNRESAEKLNERMSSGLNLFGQGMHKQFSEFSALERAQSDRLRQENNAALKAMGEWLGNQLGTHLNTASIAQKEQLSAFEVQLRSLVQTNKQDASQLREELFKSFTQFGEALTKQVTDATSLQGQRFEQFETRLAALSTNSTSQISQMRELIEKRLTALQEDSTKKWEVKRAEDTKLSNQTRQELHESLQRLADSVSKNVSAASEAQRTQSESFLARIDKISENTEKRLDGLRGVVDERLKSMQEDNTKKLDAMRLTVDEKLQGTLDKRLGESFKLVSERLELVHKGLGEMQTLANGVGDLKKVLSNVKTRGNWGEIQLGNLLEQMLTSQQYARDVATVPGSNERVEFAIRLPGRDEGQEEVWLPIDAKFPQEDYARLIEAHDAGDVEAIETLGKQLETQIKKCGQDICSKYIQAPYTTDFAIMFLPVEGLYAEVIRRTGLVDILHRQCRVTIAGPTTLAAILNSLQMGFRTLAIQQRSSEVWGTLSAVKTEFGKYGEVLDAVQKKLKEASNKIDDTRVRSRAIERKLRDVEALPEQTPNAAPLLMNGDLL